MAKDHFPPLPLTAHPIMRPLHSGEVETLTVNQLTSGSIIAQDIELESKGATLSKIHANYVAGVSGWQIDSNGDAEFNDVTVRGDFIGNWDGADPVNLATPDLTATTGFAFDSSVGSAQFMGDFFIGGDFVLISDGSFATDTSGQRIEMSSANKGSIFLHSGSSGTVGGFITAPFGGATESLRFTTPRDDSARQATMEWRSDGLFLLGGVYSSATDNDTFLDLGDSTADQASLTVGGVEMLRLTEAEAATDVITVGPSSEVDLQVGGVSVPRGEVAYAEITSNVTPATGANDVTGLSVTFTPLSGRRYKVTAWLRLVSPSAAGGLVMKITDGGGTQTVLGAETLATNENRVTVRSEVFTGGGSEITRKVVAETFSSRTITIGGAAGGRSYIQVEDIGAA